jgi:hypothetical protein
MELKALQLGTPLSSERLNPREATERKVLGPSVVDVGKECLVNDP